MELLTKFWQYRSCWLLIGGMEEKMQKLQHHWGLPIVATTGIHSSKKKPARTTENGTMSGPRFSKLSRKPWKKFLSKGGGEQARSSA